MTLEEIKRNKPEGATGYLIGRLTGNIIYVKDNMIWCYAHNEWISFVHNMEIKPL